MDKIISDRENLIILFLIQALYQKERQKMKLKIKDEDLVVKDLEEAVKRLPLSMRLAGLRPEERLEGLKPEERLKALKVEELKPEELLKALKVDDLKRLKELLDKLNLN